LTKKINVRKKKGNGKKKKSGKTSVVDSKSQVSFSVPGKQVTAMPCKSKLIQKLKMCHASLLEKNGKNSCHTSRKIETIKISAPG
jgi:hypothetical protein